MPSIDFNALRRILKLEDVMGALTIRSVGRRRAFTRGPCPVPCGTNPRLCKYNLSRGLWFCFGCRKGGSAFELVCTAKGLGYHPAALWICEQLGLVVPLLPGYTALDLEPRSKPRKDVDGP